MTVLVDTSVWSLALRRQGKDLNPDQKQIAQELAELIQETRAQLIGPVRQELLSGIRDQAQHDKLRRDLRAFDHVPLQLEDYEEAARASNLCRAEGVLGSPVDFLICAVALRRNWHVFTIDGDFTNYAKYLALRLHSPRSSR